MKNKRTTTKFLAICAGIFFCSPMANAQMSGTHAFMLGNYVEIGIDGDGGYEGAPVTTFPGSHYRSNNPLFGFVANPQMDGWVNYDGDFFTPGSPENGWGFEIGSSGGPAASNNCIATSIGIPGTITSWTSSGGQILCDWEGDYTTGTNLHFKINYDLHLGDLFYITTISVTNNSGATINDFYYYRNLDPDNNIMLTGDYSTQNTVVSQISMGDANTSVKATQALPWVSLFEFIAVDPGWIAGFGGFANRDASDLYNATGPMVFTQTVGATNLMDEAIYLAYKIPSLAPSSTGVFKCASVFEGSAVSAAVGALSSVATSVPVTGTKGEVLSIYPNPMNENSTVRINDNVQLNNASFHIYDVVGREISSQTIDSHEFKILNSKLPKGVYFYKIINNEEVIATGKVLMK